MTWNTNAGKSEVLLSADTRSATFKLSGKTLTKVKEVSYMGISLSSQGVTETRMLERIRNAKFAVYQLRPLGVSMRVINALKAIKVYRH